ncbi:MAG: DUF5131 family protein [Deltaproteobacteria bacterium]|nr:DUF5131 family protein [Deltaproteobacteria bacterium]MBW2319039.1 DUF5131 family protein [Deltaproteobacteria bacterium]MBW2600755.1 DUF5131 family protein [Deltaproteobacteria bacterium]
MSVFNRQWEKSILQWCKWSWDPITGCEHDCKYCAAIEVVRKWYSQTRNKAYSSFSPRLWPERFDAPYNTPIPQDNTSGNRNVFLGGLGDMFGDWVGNEHIEEILNIIRDTPQWNYIMLTKNPERYLDFSIPSNCWLGVKVDRQKEVKPAIDCFSRIKASIRFVSCDPMLEWLHFSTLECFEWIIVGSQPKTKDKQAFIPPSVWVSGLARQARALGCKVFAKHLKDSQYKEFPGKD